MVYINNIIYEGTKLTKRMKPHAENINKKEKACKQTDRYEEDEEEEEEEEDGEEEEGK